MAFLHKHHGTWGLIWTDNNRSKKQTRESLKTSNRNKAIRLKARLEHEYYSGEHDPWVRKWYEHGKESSNTALFGAIEEFIFFKTTAKGQQGWSESTAKRETYVMRKFCRLTGPDKSVAQITAKDLESFYYRPAATSDHTRNGDYISVNTFLNWCIKNEIIKEKPLYKPKKPQRKIAKFIYPDDFAQLIRYRIDKISNDLKQSNLLREERAAFWVPLGWMILAGTGLRPIELCRLKLQHIEQYSVIIGEDFTTKVRAERRVPLLFEARQAVDLLTCAAFRQKEPSMRHSNYLLGRKPSYAKQKLSRDFTVAWQNCFPQKAKRTLYNLKDMFAVRFLSDDSVPSNSGMKLNDLKEILGHASLETTQKYLKAVPFGTIVQGTIWD